MPNFGLMLLEKTRKAEDTKSSILFLFFRLYALIDSSAI